MKNFHCALTNVDFSALSFEPSVGVYQLSVSKNYALRIANYALPYELPS